MEEYTRFERARMIGARALQIAMGAPTFVERNQEDKPIDIAKRELSENKIPLTVKE